MNEKVRIGEHGLGGSNGIGWTLRKGTPVVFSIATMFVVLGAALGMGWTGSRYYFEVQQSISDMDVKAQKRSDLNGNAIEATNKRIDAMEALSAERFDRLREGQREVKASLDALAQKVK